MTMHPSEEIKLLNDTITFLRGEVERLRAALKLADAVWPLAYKDVKASSARDFSDETLRAWRAYDAARAAIKETT